MGVLMEGQLQRALERLGLFLAQDGLAMRTVSVEPSADGTKKVTLRCGWGSGIGQSKSLVEAMEQALDAYYEEDLKEPI